MKFFSAEKTNGFSLRRQPCQWHETLHDLYNKLSFTTQRLKPSDKNMTPSQIRPVTHCDTYTLLENQLKCRILIFHQFLSFRYDLFEQKVKYLITVFENHRKVSLKILQAKRAGFTFLADKSSLKMPKIGNLTTF